MGLRVHTPPIHPLQTVGSGECTPHTPPWAVGSLGYPWVQPHREVPAFGTRRLHPSPGPGGPVRLSRALGGYEGGQWEPGLSMGPLLPLTTSHGSHRGLGGHMKHCRRSGDKDALWGQGEPGGTEMPPLGRALLLAPSGRGLHQHPTWCWGTQGHLTAGFWSRGMSPTSDRRLLLAAPSPPITPSAPTGPAPEKLVGLGATAWALSGRKGRDERNETFPSHRKGRNRLRRFWEWAGKGKKNK